MSKHQELRQLLFRLLKSNLPVQTFEAKVVSVDKDSLTCELAPTDEAPTLFDARLNAVVDSQESYAIMFPKVDSIVLASVINNDPKDVYIVAISEIESLEVRIGEMTVKHDSNGHVFNGGEMGGLVITPTLRQELERSNELIGSLLDVINGAPVLEPGNGAASNLQVALKEAINGKSLGNYSEIENEKVKH